MMPSSAPAIHHPHHQGPMAVISCPIAFPGKVVRLIKGHMGTPCAKLRSNETGCGTFARDGGRGWQSPRKMVRQ